MNKLLNNITIFFLIILFGCNTQKKIVGKYKSQNLGSTFYLVLSKNNQGYINYTNEYRKKIHDSIQWNYESKRKVIVLDKLKVDTLKILFSNVLLYGGKNILMRTDSAYFLFYRIKTHFTKGEKDFYLYQLKISGYEEKFIKKHFGDSLVIFNKIRSATTVLRKL